MGKLVGLRFENIEIVDSCVHTTGASQRLLVLHGDEFDALIRHSFLAALAGDAAYRALLCLNRLVHSLHEMAGQPYWSLAQHVKTKLSNAQHYIESFQRASLQAARTAGVDGIVCGHIHKADLVECDGLTYCNDGDWVESCTALVEHSGGELEIVTWRPKAAEETVPAPIRDAA